MPRSQAAVRREAFLDAIAWLEYRAVVCRVEEGRHDEKSRAAATERSARFELELAIREIAKMATTRRASRGFKATTAERERFVRESCPPTYSPGRGDRVSTPDLDSQETRHGEG